MPLKLTKDGDQVEVVLLRRVGLHSLRSKARTIVKTNDPEQRKQEITDWLVANGVRTSPRRL